jgi:hypothetical protein
MAEAEHTDARLARGADADEMVPAPPLLRQREAPPVAQQPEHGEANIFAHGLRGFVRGHADDR